VTSYASDVSTFSLAYLSLTDKGSFKALKVMASSRREALSSSAAPPSTQPQRNSLAGTISVASELLVRMSRLLLTRSYKDSPNRNELKRTYLEDQLEQPLPKRNLVSRPMRRVLDSSRSDIHKGPPPTPELVNVRVNGLVNKLTPATYEKDAYSHVIQVPAHTTIEGMSECLLKEQPSTCRRKCQLRIK
jgi:hypothetical protein